jgi:hypothetical protein
MSAILLFWRSAQGETRTLKRQFSTASETATFTNFATWACRELKLCFFPSGAANIRVQFKCSNKYKNY